MHVVDLTQRLSSSTAVWPGAPPPSFEPVESLERDGAFSRAVTLFEHAGTHIDAPAHFVAAGVTADALSADRLVRPFAVIDVERNCRDDPDYGVTVADVEGDVERRGPIVPGSIVAARTGWDRLIGSEPYLGDPPRFPGFTADAAERLVTDYGVEALAIDTPGIDPGRDSAFTVHATTTLPRGVWHVEGLVHLDRVPARGALIVVGALPIAGASGAPARVFALVPD